MKTYSDEQLLPLSGIQHYAMCRRQWALIHVENQWQDNFLTAQGQIIHQQADDPFFSESRGDLYISRAQPLLSYRLGLQGVADVVEFRQGEQGVALFGKQGLWQPKPIEYKRGKPKAGNWDAVQVCAQAICLEEMLQVVITEGAIYYHQTRHRVTVACDSELRATVVKMADDMHKMLAASYTPRAEKTKSCRACSLADLCLPQLTAKPNDVQAYLAQHVKGGDGV